jgi:hypothetical protein
MKKVNLFSLSLLLMTTAFFTACDEKEDNPAPIVVANTSALTQNVFADQTEGQSGVTFTTTGAWTFTITETTTKSPAATVETVRAPSLQRAAANSPTWISISPDHGDKAGDYTIAITLQPNTTGADRAAIITVSCNGTEIAITVTQKSTTESGEEPEVFNRTITGQIKNVGDYNITQIKAYHYLQEAVLATGACQNGNFSITLPETVESSYLSSFGLPSSITLSDPNVKQTHIGAEEDGNIVAYDNAGNSIGKLWCISENFDNEVPQVGMAAIHSYMYVDKDCKITGSRDNGGGVTVTYNVDLKAGWNVTYVNVLNAGGNWEITTTKPAVELKWYIESGEEPAPTAKLVTRIDEFSSDTATVAFSSTTFEYDSDNRLVKVQSNGNAPTNIIYSANTIQADYYGGGEYSITYRLNSKGYVEDDGTNSYSYDSNGFLSLRKDKSDDETYGSYSWQNGNLQSLINKFILSGDNFYMTETLTFEYGALPNKPCGIDIARFITAAIGGWRELPIYDLFGKSMKNLPSRMELQTWGTFLLYNYQTDSNGYVTKVTRNDGDVYKVSYNQ